MRRWAIVGGSAAVFDVRRFTGGDGRPQRISMSIRSAGGARGDITAEFLEIGVSADVEPPAPEAVIEQDALFLDGS